MHTVKITAIRKADYTDLQQLYENPIEHTCSVSEGDTWLSVNARCPDGFCESAWHSMQYFVQQLAAGGGNFYDGWMKNPRSAMISCNDGFRPVSFLLETIDQPPKPI
ncbi:MAG: TIGR04076 family protein [Bacteroidales bacterium]|nr:TIGR04076 family protein [Bacteroidales bacterium]